MAASISGLACVSHVPASADTGEITAPCAAGAGRPAAACAGRRQTTIVAMLGVGTEVVVVLLLLVANGVFAMSEISIVAARKVRLQQRADDGDRRAGGRAGPGQLAHAVPLHRAGRHLARRRAGRAPTAARPSPSRCSRPFVQVPLVAPYARGLSLGLVVAVITYLSLIIGELVPKRIGLNHPETIASWVARPMLLLARIGGPIVALLTGSTNLVLRDLRHQGPRRGASHRRRDPRRDQPGRRERRARGERREPRAAGVPRRRSARRRDHDAAPRHRVGGRGCRRRRAARVPDRPQPRAVRRVPRARSTTCSARCAPPTCSRWR